MIRISSNSISNNGIRVRAICDRSASNEVVDGYGDRSGCNPDVLATKAVRFRPASLMAFFENRIVAAKKRNAGSRMHGEPASRVRRLMAGQRILNPPFEGSIPSAPTSAVVARVAEQRTFNPLGTGSSPVDGTRGIGVAAGAPVLQIGKMGSTPISRTSNIPASSKGKGASL